MAERAIAVHESRGRVRSALEVIVGNDDEQTPRQKALSLLLAAERPIDLYPILRQHAAARDPSIAAELAEQAEMLERFRQEGAADRLREMARVLGAINDRINDLARAETREMLLGMLRESTVAWSPQFYDLVEHLATSVEVEDPDRAKQLRRGLALRRELETALEELHSVFQQPQTAYEVIRSNPTLRDPLFHEYVLLLVKNNIDDPAQAGAWRRGVAGLVESCRVLAAEEQRSQAKPITFDEAANWFGLPDDLDELASVAAVVAADGTVPVRDVVDRFVRLLVSPGDQQADVQLAMIFLENACRHAPQAAPAFLAEMRRLIDLDIEWMDRVHATHALHYAMSLLLRWRVVPDTVAILSSAERLLADVVPSVDPVRGPRLIRDLHWQRGQLLQNLGEWQPDRFADAISEFRIALDVPAKLQHELVPRALILSDLANALNQHHLHCGTATRAVEDERFALYKEALQLLDANAEPLRRAMALGNMAIFLNEREGGDLGYNQEQALEHVHEAIALLSRLGEDGNVLLQARRAAMQRTRGNILYSRLYGNPIEMAKAAIEAYDLALADVPTQDVWLRGTIQLNRANAYSRLALVEEKHGTSAFYAFEEARSLLSQARDSVSAAKARAGQAYILDREPSSRVAALEQLKAAIAELHGVDAYDAVAPMHHRLGVWLLRNASMPEEFVTAASSLIDASRAHEGRGDTTSAAHSAVMASHALHEGGRIDEARQNAKRSVELAESVWARASSIEDRVEAGELWASANAQLLWFDADAISAEEAWGIADRSKANELRRRVEDLPVSTSTLDVAAAELRTKARQLLVEQWRVQRERATPETSLAKLVDVMRESGRDLDERLTLVARTREAQGAARRVAALVDQDRALLVVDVTVAESGTVILRRDSAGTSIIRTKLTRQELLVASLEWQHAYQERKAAPGQWQNALDGYLAMLGERVLKPALANVPPSALAAARILFLPGLLLGKPLHAAPLDGRPVCEVITDFAYAATSAGIARGGEAPKQALCILSDNAPAGKQLKCPPKETNDIVDALTRAGIKTTVIAQRGPRTGRVVFDEAGLNLTDQASVLADRPTPAKVLELVGEADHVFYTGHGVGGAVHALVLIDDGGAEVLMSTLDLFGASSMRGKTIVLSACETAHEPVLASTEPTSIAAALLQLGASFVLGSAWVAIDTSASALCRLFHEALAAHEWESRPNVRGGAARATRCAFSSFERVGDVLAARWSISMNPRPMRYP